MTGPVLRAAPQAGLDYRRHMEIFVVYELDQPAGARVPVHEVHAAPSTPGDPGLPGPRTFCGKDTFAMRAASWRPSEHPGEPWYPPEYADRVCGTCDEAAAQ